MRLPFFMANQKAKPYLKIFPFPAELKKRCSLKAEITNKDLRAFVIEHLRDAVGDLPDLLRREAVRIEKEGDAKLKSEK